MATRPQKVKVGAFIIASIVLFSGAIYIISDLQSVDYVRYKMVFEESILGLAEGSPVNYLGIPVGTVDLIRVSQNNTAHVEILVNPTKLANGDHGLREGVIAKLQTVNFAAGTMSVALENKDPGARIFDPGEFIPTETSTIGSFTTQFQDAMGGVREMLTEINDALDTVNTEVLGELSSTLRGVNEFTTQATDTLKVVQGDIHLGVDDLRGAIQDFRDLTVASTELARNIDATVTDFRTKIEPIDLAASEAQFRGEFVALSGKLQKMADDLSASTQNILYDADNVRHEMVEVIRNLNEAINVLVEVVEPLREDPSALVRGRGRPRSSDQ